MWQTVLSGLQPAHSCQNSHGRPTVRLPLRRLQQEVCPEHEFKISHTDPHKTQVCPLFLPPSVYASTVPLCSHCPSTLAPSFYTRTVLSTHTVLLHPHCPSTLAPSFYSHTVPLCSHRPSPVIPSLSARTVPLRPHCPSKIGRASCRERV